ncbi:glycan-binding surface protein [Flaviramulus sp. BrNp1-15]|uniref:glycan-binding surface protein n=1 Tax=Flaviramulus sp. BrNp1-15 TaxID=2916754 RepID=UPI001EE7DC37|nr:glycan-binding surface protein [Flaviramulus sp. BrNp1-15]ULC58780.1 glycan-binding surface protein [Flaviramulus sp. BrNp1-15]
MRFFAIIITAMLYVSCEDDDASGSEIIIENVYLQDVNSTVQDRQISFARLGQLLRIQGSGFTGLKKVYINGFDTFFNTVYVSDNSMVIRVSGDTPTIDAEESVRNTIRMVNNNFETTFSFEIRAAAPSIRSISNTLPNPGEQITVYGSGLLEIIKVIFPGDVEVTTDITYDEEDGEFFTVTVPDGVSEDGGSLFIESANGGAYSPAYFNFKKGVILDFEGSGSQGFWSWSETGSMINDEDLESASIGSGNISQGTYVAHRPARIASFPAVSNRNSEVWTAGNDVDNWRGQLTPYIPASTPLEEVAFQFDVYVPEAWEGSGFLKICLDNSFNGGEWSRASYNYVPWIVNGEVEAFQTTGWTTVTVPLNMFYAFSDADYTFEDVLAYREAANFKNFGFFFENSDFTLANITGNDSDSETEFASSPTSVNVYTDNWRIVSLETPTFSDFPE